MLGEIPDLVAKRAELTPNAVALEEVVTGRTLTYGELDRRACAAASLMRGMGVREGERVAILCRNRSAFFEILFGCAKIGAILVPLNWRMPAAELDGLVADAEPKLLIVGQEDLGSAKQLVPALPILELDGDYEERLARAAPASFRRSWQAGATWYLIYTSGTTGQPKGVINTFRMALANYVNIGTAIGLTDRDATPNFLPLFHTAGINLHSLPTLFAGGSVIVLPGFDPELLVQLLEARRLDAFFGVPTVYQSLLDHPGFADTPLEHVRHWGCGGAPLPDRLVERYRSIGVRVCNGMGMTETGPTAFLLDPAHAWEKAGSVGKPQLLCSARILAGDGSEAVAGETGDLQFSGPGITPGYWRNPEATRAAFTEDGWLRSGDLASRDADGFYYVAGRQKEMFISGGENVYPAEVENVLCSHPAIAAAAVVSAPDPHWGEVARAFVQILPHSQPPAPQDLAAYCRQRLAGYKVPASFEFIADFPRSSAGKIQKHLLG